MRATDWQTWYNQLKKPSWTPSGQTIGVIWSILYPIIIGVFIAIVIRTSQGDLPWYILTIAIVNLISNALFTYIQFKMKNLTLASVDIAVVWVTIIAVGISLWPHSKLLVLLLLPYFVWVSIASTIQLSITRMNR
jgi:translocator protein